MPDRAKLELVGRLYALQLRAEGLARRLCGMTQQLANQGVEVKTGDLDAVRERAHDIVAEIDEVLGG